MSTRPRATGIQQRRGAQAQPFRDPSVARSSSGLGHEQVLPTARRRAQGASLWAVTAAMVLSTPIYANPYFIIDPNPEGPALIQFMTDVGGALFFSADDGVHGEELWRSNGTTYGTYMVKDLWPGAERSLPATLTKVGSLLFYQTDDGTTGRELWMSSGAPGDIRLIKDINANPGGSSDPSGYAYISGCVTMAVLDGNAFFAAQDGTGTTGRELWKSDGTPEGTMLVRDVEPGPDGSWPTHLAVANDFVFFSVSGTSTGSQLWRTDGTFDGTIMLANVQAGWTTAVGDVVYFMGDDGVIGRELWKSDGTMEGTVLVKDINPGEFFSDPDAFQGIGETVFFRATDGEHGTELWKSDGTEAGTVMIKDIRPDGTSWPRELTELNGLLYFSAYDPVYGRELWVSDGTEAGTLLVKDINTEGSSTPDRLSTLSGKLYFIADDGVHGKEIWQSDGSAEGTFMVADLNPGPSNSLTEAPTPAGGLLFFSASNGQPGGSGLWAYDPDPPLIPTASVWGIAAMALSLLAAGSVLARRRARCRG